MSFCLAISTATERVVLTVYFITIIIQGNKLHILSFLGAIKFIISSDVLLTESLISVAIFANIIVNQQ